MKAPVQTSTCIETTPDYSTNEKPTKKKDYLGTASDPLHSYSSSTTTATAAATATATPPSLTEPLHSLHSNNARVLDTSQARPPLDTSQARPPLLRKTRQTTPHHYPCRTSTASMSPLARQA
ncbi:hypothetical protein E6O75_ATG06339 [Venturia nashicola]|uniref:Uncharacterized protein n=1 Tax=Venturia nashicola TaxID=86259 RepID=A0A4Z1NXJ1_9PEZI|nr:hypothetical protein E6O75_ATG06339 [Venturia nashicola]